MQGFQAFTGFLSASSGNCKRPFKTRSTVLRNRRFPDIFEMSPDHVIIDVVNYENYTYNLAVMAKEDLYSENPRYRDIGFVSNFY